MTVQGRFIGNRGTSWRALVTEHGSVVPPDGRVIDWYVAADDRWHDPKAEPTTRQKWYSGYPVAETRVKIPGGDLIQRVYCTADLGGLTVIDLENDSPMPVVVALTRSDLFTTRQPADNPPQGIDLPSGSIVIPVGHRASSRAAISHVRPEPGRLPEDTPNHQQVVRGWETACDRPGRITVPDHTIVANVARLRSDLLLGVGADDAAIELVRLGETDPDSILRVVDAVQARLKEEKRAKVLRWDTRHLLLTAATACVRLGDETAAGDIGAAWLRFADRDVQELPVEMPAGLPGIAWIEEVLASGSPSGGECRVLTHGVPQPWWGASFEVHGLPADPFRTLSYAVRWHGARPALLWETGGQPGLVLSHGDWHSTDATGEVLLPAPAGAPHHDHDHVH